MYYKGTYEQLITYDEYVSAAINVSYRGDNWSTPQKHPTEDIWYVIAHPDYECDAEYVDELDSSWIGDVL